MMNWAHPPVKAEYTTTPLSELEPTDTEPHRTTTDTALLERRRNQPLPRSWDCFLAIRSSEAVTLSSD